MVGFVVELLGPPGAGKTVLARTLAEVPGVTVVEDHDRHDLPAAAAAVPHALPAMLSHPPAGVDRVQWATCAGRLAAAPRVARHRLAEGASTVVFDQGAAHALVRMLGVRRRPAGNAWWWRRSVETANLLDLLVVLDADPDTLLGRRRGGHGSTLVDGPPSDAARDRVGQERTACAIVADVLAREGARTRRLVTSEVSVHEQAEIVMALLHRRRLQRA